MSELAYSTVISPNDQMWASGSQWYFDVGRSAMDCISMALAAAHIEPQSILDLPCGHGRVCRMLRAAYPSALLSVCDLDRDGVDFCAREFGAEAIYSSEDLRTVAAGRTFDLIWCGSLFTHLDKDRWGEFLEFFADRLAPNGVFVFTTHGRQPIQWMQENFYNYGLTRSEQQALVEGYTERGFGFVAPANQIFGVSLSSVAFACTELERCPSLKLVGVYEHAWAGHQDVFCCQRLSRAYPTRRTLRDSGPEATSVVLRHAVPPPPDRP